MKKSLILTMFLFSSAIAQDTKTQEIEQILGQNSYEPNYFSMILGLFIVIALIYLTGFFYQKLTKANFNQQEVYLNKAQIISTTSLGQGRNLHIIKIGDDACLIGATQNNITYIKDVKLQTPKKEDLNNDKNS